jgi:hypothetical protein
MRYDTTRSDSVASLPVRAPPHAFGALGVLTKAACGDANGISTGTAATDVDEAVAGDDAGAGKGVPVAADAGDGAPTWAQAAALLKRAPAARQ